MKEMRATVDQVTTWEFISNNAYNTDTDVIIPLADKTIRLPMQIAIMNGMLWPIYTTFKIPITKDKVFWPDRSVEKETGKIIYSFTSETVARCTSDIYNELILKYKIKNYMDGVAQVWLSINKFSTFADKYTREWQVSLDALSLSELCVQKPMKEIIDRQLDSSHGTKYAEQQFEKITKDLMGVLGRSDILKNNTLRPFMLTKLLKRNQIPQQFACFGTRSDIDDTMMKHPVSASAFSGLTGVEDFAIESLSAKKAEYFNSSVIQDAQYFARRCRLVASRTPTLHPGSCGSKVTIPFVIEPAHKHNFLGKFVKVDDDTRDLLAKRKWEPQWGEDDSIELTKVNIDRFVGREIQMWSPFGCKHTDGCCEHCAGYMHQRLQAYIPPDVHLGVFEATQTVSSVTQKILSAKHLIKTSSKEFVLQPRASKYFMKSGDAIVWQPGVRKGIRNCYIRLENDSLMGPMSDLTRKIIPSGVSFSRISRIAIVNQKGEAIDSVEIADDVTFPYFSQYMMEYMRNIFKDIKIDSDYVDIPMQKFDFDKALLKYTAVNDDMVSFVKRVEGFVMGGVSEYTSISSCLHDFSELIYDKTDVNFFAVEMMLRGYLVSADSSSIPVITDPREPVRFAGLSSVISSAALSTKLSFQGVTEFFRDPKPTLNEIGDGYGYYDVLYNFSNVS